jgi:S-adenosylmethionine synthetase
MENREIIFEKIHAKEKEWKAQVEYLQSKIINYDLDRRVKIERLIDLLNIKLNEIENRTSELKKISGNLHQDLGEKLIYSWVELFTEIDNSMINLKNKLR